jgi:hypothetical protein
LSEAAIDRGPRVPWRTQVERLALLLGPWDFTFLISLERTS